ncbi:methyl-CpG-binding domain-containing protein 7 isoform X1 [Vigna radiata var. radiata]|uniref:Methyl-CpG-binding domain-containing protein 7 isoform X1 n=1 Tax=Vigna radiata var. radiata TaxID=3916 RepID=A0A1S3T965_VIGRR|nr:methyl-CpG-binding domain-containing protein 7 isoform X1 [Vigna radiata var. radiata]
MSYKEDILNGVSSDLHVGVSSHFKLPEGWIVEEKARPSKPTHVDRYYYEPHTRRKFRSLSSVQKYLAQVAQEAGDHDITETKISKDGNTSTNYSQSREGKQLAEKPSTPITKFAVESEEKIVRGIRSCRNRAYSSPSQEETVTPKSSKHSNQYAGKKPVKLDSQKKINFEKNNKAPVHNLTGSPPEKVSWVLSGPDGFWNPFVDGLAVPEAERLRWSEAFVQSLRNNRN